MPRRRARDGDPALDLDDLDRQTFGDLDLRGELLRLFAGQCRRLLPAIAGRRGEEARRDAAHSLKGAARAVGAGRVAALSDRLEESAGVDGVSVGGLAGELRLAIGEARRAMRALSLAKPASLA